MFEQVQKEESFLSVKQENEDIYEEKTETQLQPSDLEIKHEEVMIKLEPIYTAELELEMTFQDDDDNGEEVLGDTMVKINPMCYTYENNSENEEEDQPLLFLRRVCEEKRKKEKTSKNKNKKVKRTTSNRHKYPSEKKPPKSKTIEKLNKQRKPKERKVKSNTEPENSPTKSPRKRRRKKAIFGREKKARQVPKPVADNPVSCKKCRREFRNLVRFRKHMETHDDTDTVCPKCWRICKSKASMKRHLARVHKKNNKNGGLYECLQCGRMVTTSAMLTRHMQRMHGERIKNFQCDHCQRVYYTKAEVRAHIMWTHLGARGGHACAACGRVFRTPARLREHAARAHSAIPVRKDHHCPECGKAFATTQLLNRHQKVHSDETFPCSDCDRTFKSQTYVKVHYKLKHLNMTRQEIRAQSTRPQPVTVKKGMKLASKIDPHSLLDDPLFFNHADMQNVRDVCTPLFNMFVDVQNIT